MGVRHVKHFKAPMSDEITTSSNYSVYFSLEDLGLPAGAAVVGVSLGVRITSGASDDLVLAWYPVFRDEDGTVRSSSNSLFTRAVSAGSEGIFLMHESATNAPLTGPQGFKILVYKSGGSWTGPVTFYIHSATVIVEY